MARCSKVLDTRREKARQIQPSRELVGTSGVETQLDKASTTCQEARKPVS